MDNMQFINLLDKQGLDTFVQDVTTGLTASSKYIPVKYVYDDLGSQLFEQVTQQPEYYLTRAEKEILARFAPEIVQQLAENTALVELGCGNALKTRFLIEALLQKQGKSLFVPIDIAEDFLFSQSQKLRTTYADLDVLGVAADYHDGLEILLKHVTQPKLIIWLGSDIGHLPHAQAAEMLREQVISVMNPEDKLLIGVDLKKSADTISAAYGSKPKTLIRELSHALAANGLKRVNQRLQGDIVLDNFDYNCGYNDDLGCIEISLKSLCDQSATLGSTGVTVNFAQDELVRIHHSYKYNTQELQQLAQAAGLQLEQQWFDEQGLYSLNLLSLAG